jgi:hypothetical protein
MAHIQTAAKTIHFLMQDVITMKFLELNPERPEAVEQDEPAGVVSIVLGFALMMALDVAL